MKIIGVFLAFLLTASTSFGQDTIFLKQEGSVLAKVKEIGPKEISYIKFDYQDGPLYKTMLEDVVKIHFQNGMKQFFNKPAIENQSKATPLPEEKKPKDFSALTYFDGQRDAYMYYKGYRGTGTGNYLAGLTILYLIPVPIITSISKPANARLYAPNQEAYMKNSEYAMGFNKGAHNIKSQKAWTNYGLGAATTLGAYIAIIIYAIAQFGTN